MVGAGVRAAARRAAAAVALCVQLGEAEVEAVELVRGYQCCVHELAQELVAAKLIVSTSSRDGDFSSLAQILKCHPRGAG